MNSANRKFLLFMLLLLGTSTTIAQSPDMPKTEIAKYPCELISERRVFVDAPLNQRDEIVKQLTKHSDLVIVERPEEADFFLTFTNALQVAGGGNFLQLDSAETAAAEIVVWNRVNDLKGGERQRVLLHWSGRNSFYSATIPWSGITSSGFRGPSSGKKAGAELIGRGVLEIICRIWPGRCQVDQYRNQVTIIKGGKLETEGAKWFLDQLKKIRNGFYDGGCAGRRLTPRSSVIGSLSSELDSEAPELYVPSSRPFLPPPAGDLSDPSGPGQLLDPAMPPSGRPRIFTPGSSQAPPKSKPLRSIPRVGHSRKRPPVRSNRARKLRSAGNLNKLP
jgi:hypothetical protein